MADRTVAVIGLGLMGSRMARQLAFHGFDVRGFDTDSERMQEFEDAGGIGADSPAEAVHGCWAALLSLPDSDVSRAVCLGAGGLSGAGIAPLFVYDATTGRPADALEIGGALAEAGVTYCDATVSGNGEVAERGELVVMIGGPVEAYQAGTPIFDAIGRSHHHVGEVGAGARMKLLVNHALTIHRMALAEVLVSAELGGLDLAATIGVLKDSLAYSKAMDAWGDRMIIGDHSKPFARLRQSNKDARLILELGHDVGAPVPLAEVVASALAEGVDTGLGDMDNSAVVEVIRRRAGIGRLS